VSVTSPLCDGPNPGTRFSLELPLASYSDTFAA
jgi:hypothetical protein